MKRAPRSHIRRNTGSRCWPSAAASPRSAGLSRRPAASATTPLATSSPPSSAQKARREASFCTLGGGGRGRVRPVPLFFADDEYADYEYADYDAEDREQPSVAAAIPDDEPQDDVLEQCQEIPYGDDDR